MSQPASPYPGLYPLGAFLVDGTSSLAPLVAELRVRRRLKGGCNVTPFHPTEAVLAAAGEPEEGQALKDFILRMREMDGDDDGGESGPFSAHRVTVAVAASGSADVLRAKLPLQPFSPSSSPARPGPSSPSSSLYAVHTTGAWGEEELAALLAPSLAGGLALAYVHQLRVYSAACAGLDQQGGGARPLSAAAQSFHQLKAARQRQLQQAKGKNEAAAAVRGKESARFRFSELFGGIGMFRLGLERAGGVASFAVELAPPARTVYETNFTASSPLAADVTEIPSACFPAHDLLTAGFPCQSFAKAGPADGLHGAKGWLFYEVVRVLHASQPRAFLLENVAHLVDVEEGAQLQEILRCLRAPDSTTNGTESARYCVGFRVMDGAVVTPQTRRRVYFVGIRVDSAGKDDGDDGDEPLSLLIEEIFNDAEKRLAAMGASRPYRRVRDLLEPQVLTSQEEGEGGANSLVLTNTQWEAVQRSHTYRQNPSWRLVNLDGNARTLLGSYRTSYQLYSEFVPSPDHLLTLPAEAFTRRVVEAAATLPSHREEGEEKRGAFPVPPLRFFSLRECARLQGIPDDFRFPLIADDGASRGARSGPALLPPGAVYKLIGNAVNPLVIECLGHSIADHLFS